MGCCGGMGCCAILGLGAVGPAEPFGTGTARPFAVLRVIFLVAPLLACFCKHVFVDHTQSLMDPGLPVS